MQTQTNAGQLLLLLASREPQTMAQLTAATDLPPAETLRQLQQLIDRGFIVLATAAGVAVYQLNPKGVRTEAALPQERILIVEDDAAVRDLLTVVLEDEGYAVIVSTTPLDAATLAETVAFDLVITDGFSEQARAVFTSTAALRAVAGVTPVALFSAHRLELTAAQAAGFADLISKPFELDGFEAQVRTLLRHAAP